MLRFAQSPSPPNLGAALANFLADLLLTSIEIVLDGDTSLVAVEGRFTDLVTFYFILVPKAY